MSTGNIRRDSAAVAADNSDMTVTRSMYDRIEERRQEFGLSQIEVERRAALSRSWISDLRKKKRQPSAESVVRLARVLQTTVEWLLWEEGDKEASGPRSDDEYALLSALRELSPEERKAVIRLLTGRDHRRAG